MIKRENWKGKYYLVLRSRGKIISKKLWDPKTSASDKRIARKNNTFDPKVTKRLLYKDGKPSTWETTDYRENPRSKLKQINMQQVTIKVGKITVTGRSRSSRYWPGYNTREARLEAEQNAYRRLSSALGGDYTVDSGRNFVARSRKQVLITSSVARYGRA